MSEAQPSYRRRNIALAIVTSVIAIFAASKLMLGRAPEVRGGPTAPAADASIAGDAGISVEVTFAGAADALPDTAKVYVFIRPVGERMPLAVQTYSPGDLPVVVNFSRPSPNVSAQSVEAVARLSMTGAVALQPADVQAVSEALRFDAGTKRTRLSLAASATSAIPADGFKIPVHVAIALDRDLPPTTTVFLVVRSSGKPIPLAVKRMTVADLPADLSLSDADAMVPGTSLRDAGTLELVARASLSGNAKGSPGDYEGTSGALQVDAVSNRVNLVIDHAL